LYVKAKNRFRYSPDREYTKKLVKVHSVKNQEYQRYMNVFEKANKHAV
jgi:hypothetical protein